MGSRRSGSRLHLQPAKENHRLHVIERLSLMLADHLTNPYTYIKKVVPKAPVEAQYTFVEHGDLWNTSKLVRSTRVEKQEPKTQLTLTAKSWTP